MSDALINPERAFEFWNTQAQEELDGPNPHDNPIGWGQAALLGLQSGDYGAYGAAIRGLNVATHNDDRLYWERVGQGDYTPPNRGEDPHTEDWWEGLFADADRDLQNAIRRNSQNPAVQTFAGGIIYPVTKMLTEATIGSPGGPFGSALAVAGGEGVTSYDNARREGLDPNQAMGMAFREGGYMGALTLLPAAVGGRLATRVVSGAAINVAGGAGFRYELGRYLNEQGFPELASRYRWNDTQAIAIDAILGSAFGGIHAFGARDGARDAEPVPQEVSDAALVAGADLQHQTQFGVPRDARAARWASEASARMEEQAARDEPIDPGPVPEDVSFVPLHDEAEATARLGEVIQAHLEEQGLEVRAINERLQALREEHPGLFDEDGSPLFSMGPRRAQGVGGGRPNVNLDFIRAMLDEGETSARTILQRLNQRRAELGLEPTHLRSVQSQISKAKRYTVNNATNDRQAGARTFGEPTEAMAKNMGRMASVVERLARDNGGTLPANWRETVATETGYTEGSVDNLWSLVRSGHFGEALYRRARAIPQTGQAPSAQRLMIARLMDQGLGRQAITERVNAVRNAENRRPVTPQHISVVMNQIREARAAGDQRYSLRTENGTFSTPEDLIAAAEREFGADWTALANAGRVEIVSSRSEIPTDGWESIPPNVQAVHLPRQKTTYFVSTNIRPEDMRALVLHEVGVHHGFEQMLGKRGFKEVLRQIDRMIEADHPALVEARAIAERYAAREEHVPEETLAYLIETHADLPLVNSVLSKLRQWLIKTFGTTFGMRLTVDDLRALAITSLRRVAEQARREGPEPAIVSRLNPLYSNGPDAGDAGAGTFDTSRVVYRGLGRQYDPANGGYYQSFTSSLADAREYGSNVIAAHLRPGRNLAIDGGGNNFNALSVEQLPADVRARLHPSVGASASTDQIAHAAREAGYDSVTVRNVHDNRWGERPVSGAEPRTIDFVFDTRNISPLDAVPEHTAAPAAAPERVRLTDADRALLDELERDLSAPQSPNEGNAGDFPLFSQSRQNGENLVGAKRDPIESPDYQQRLRALRERDSGQGRTGASEGQGAGSVRGVAGEPARSRAQQLADILSVSGIHLQSRPEGRVAGGRGENIAIIDTPFASELDAALQAKPGADGGPTMFHFDLVDGSNPKDTRLPGVHVRLSRVNDGAKGAKVGVWFYRQLIEWADRRGLPFYSDDLSVSRDAQFIYDSLRKRGYNVERIGPAKRSSDGSLLAAEGLPIYRVSKGAEIEEPLTGAPMPREDYQIDGPTLRERQERIDEQRQRQEEYDKKSPGEQAIADDPDMILTDIAGPMFSRGPKRRYTARQAMEDARIEAERAREMRKGFESAARCAARHGVGQAVSRVSYGVLLTPYSAMLGQALGMAAAIPVGITVAPLLAGAGNPDKYLRNRQRYVVDPLQDDAVEAGRWLGAISGMANAPDVEDPAAGQRVSDLQTTESGEEWLAEALPDAGPENRGHPGLAPADAEYTLDPAYQAARGDVQYSAHYRSYPTESGSHVRTSDIQFDPIPEPPESARRPVTPEAERNRQAIYDGLNIPTERKK